MSQNPNFTQNFQQFQKQGAQTLPYRKPSGNEVGSNSPYLQHSGSPVYQQLPTQQLYKPNYITPTTAVAHHSHSIHKKNTEEDDDYEEFEALKIPADWEEAKEHSESRKTGQRKEDHEIHHTDSKRFCKCCGYQVQRHEMSFVSHGHYDLRFLGSGFPLFYNFIIYCIVLLLTIICISGCYNMYTNYLGHYCDHDDLLASTHGVGEKINIEKEMEKCHRNFAHILSIVNKKNSVIDGVAYNTGDKYLPTQHILNLVVAGVVMIILMIFRRSQRKLDAEIDDIQCTPSDFTIIVKNIPLGLDCDYEKELRQIFTYNVVRNERGESIPMTVTKINLVYNIDHVIELEEQLAKVVKKKQQFLEKNGFRTNDPVLQDWDSEIEHIEHRIHKIEHKIPQDQKNYFTGIAFISFQNEQQKDQVVEQNTFTYWEQVSAYFNNGEKSEIKDEDLTWEQNKLYVEEAPEADDVDWEFIHYRTGRKIKARIIAWFKTIAFLSICYCAIWALTKYQSSLIESSYEQMGQGTVSQYNWYMVKLFSFSISMLIVLFNKFVLGKVFHMIVDAEYYSTKTKFNIAFAFKLTIGLFVNSALLTYFVEILSEQNFYGPGGFIYTETWVFIWNCLVPPTVWLLDPWTHMKDSKRNKEMAKARVGKCYLTQKEANELMEKVEYTQGKRYADIMKTMWFTFFYAPAIPLGSFLSLLNLIYYFFIDQYNVMKRRTIKETLSKDVSIEMIENLEMTIILYAIGNITFSVFLFGDVDLLGYILLGVALVYAILPMQQINEYLFPIERIPEAKQYQEAEKQFATDYDRQNPITKKEALKRFNKLNSLNSKKFQTVGYPLGTVQTSGKFVSSTIHPQSYQQPYYSHF